MKTMGQNIQELWKITKDLTYTEGEKKKREKEAEEIFE